MQPTVHHALFVLLPVVLAARYVMPDRPSAKDAAQGMLRFCLGVAKGTLLVSPLWHLSGMLLSGGEQSLSTGAAWISLLAGMLCLHFACTGLGDLVAGLGGMLGFKVSDAVDETLTLRRLTRSKLLWRTLALLVVTVALMPLRTPEPAAALLHLKALVVGLPKTVPSVFQETRAWSNYHVLTLLAGLACYIGVPYSRDFLRGASPGKSVTCLVLFVLAVAIEWTRNAPQP